MFSRGEKVKKCEWCGEVLSGWYLTYKRKHFCAKKDNLCLKNYLFDEHGEEIGIDYIEDENG